MAGKDFDGRVVLITGASTGLGRAIAVETAGRGAATVVINYASSEAEARETKALVRGHRDDRALFETPEIMEERMGRKLGLEPVKIDGWIGQGDRVSALRREFEIRHVPGHCPGNVLFYQAETKSAFVGDALFKAGVGRWDFPGGDFDLLAKSIREQIYTLPDDTIVFPGHGPRTTVGAEKSGNPYVAAVAR